jgi:HEPN domain-containing protein
MQDRLTHARGWLLKAESDLAAAGRVTDGDGPYDTACFHAQQAVEKLLKGFLAFRDQAFPHTHNLEELLGLCVAVEPGLCLEDVDLAELTPYAVEMRYDLEFWPDRATARTALELALKVRAAMLALVPAEVRP